MNIRERRVALFTGAYNHIADGVSLTLNRLVTHLEARGAQVAVFAPTIPHPALQHSGTLFPVHSVSAPGRPDYRISTGLPSSARDHLTRFRPNLFHIATPDLLGIGALRLARRSGVPVVASYHTHFASYLDYYRLGMLEPAAWAYLRWFYGHCRQVYAPTESMMKVLRQRQVGTDLRLWPRGVDSSRFNPDRRSLAWRRSHGVGDTELVVLFVSRLVVEKGLTILTDVLHGLSVRGIHFRAVIVGDGPERERLEAALPNAVFAGHLEGDALAEAYASSDIFLFPSDTETFGNVTLEALSSGLPAVVADATGSNALVEQNVTGYLAQAGDAAGFLECVARLLIQPETRERMSAAARRSAKAYEWSVVLAQIESYYEDAI